MSTVKIDYAVKCNREMYDKFAENFGADALEQLRAREGKYQDFGVELEAADVSGKSEKQVKYAEDLRRDEVFKRVELFAKKVNGLAVGGQHIDVLRADCPVCAQLDKMLAAAGACSISEMAAKIVGDEAKTLLAMSDAGEIIDYCNNVGIAMELIQRRKK